MTGLNEIIKDLNVVEICTVKQSYHEPALLKRFKSSFNYEIIEIDRFNIKSNYKFNFIFSAYNQKLSQPKLKELKTKIYTSDIVILHSWKGKLWKILLEYSISLKKKVIFMNDMVNEYRVFSLRWLVRKIFDLRIFLMKKNTIYFIALNNLHESVLKKRFGRINILYHQWQYCYLKNYIYDFKTKNTSNNIRELNDTKVKVLFIGRNIPRKGIKKFIKIASEIKDLFTNKISFTIAYSGAEIFSTNSFIKFIKIDSLKDNKQLYKNADILYCPYRNEPLGLVPIEGMSLGCHVFFDESIPSIYEFKKYGTVIPNSINDEIKVWSEIINNINTLRKLRIEKMNLFIQEINQMIL